MSFGEKYPFSSYCLQKDLKSFDPYDLWFSDIGSKIKNSYHSHKLLMLPLVGSMTVADWFLEPLCRKFIFTPRDYPIVHAQMALVLLSLYQEEKKESWAELAKLHLEWLKNDVTFLEQGCGWGLPVDYTVTDSLIYRKGTPLATITPYCAEAFFTFRNVVHSAEYDDLLDHIFLFFEKELVCLRETESEMGFSYGPVADRLVFNANSYTMYMLALSKNRDNNLETIKKIFHFLRNNQKPDGSWLYGINADFIDGFHTCFVLENLIKTSRLVSIPGMAETIEKGLVFWKENLIDRKTGLCKRFLQNNKPSFICYDLYDNAESISLAKLAGDEKLADSLLERTCTVFFRKGHFYSQRDICGFMHYKDSLRWAVVPFLRALSEPLAKG